MTGPDAPRLREPAVNLPPLILMLAALLLVLHGVRHWLLSPDADLSLTLMAAFIPARYGVQGGDLPYPLAALWSPVSYALLHGDWMHVGLNTLWLAAFGSPLARRIGAVRTLLLLAVGSAAGAGAVLLVQGEGLLVLVGASAAVSAAMGAAARFALALPFGADVSRAPVLTLPAMLRNGRVMAFVGVVMVANLLSGTGLLVPSGSARIAWEAHVAGFLVGLLALPLLDRRRGSRLVNPT